MEIEEACGQGTFWGVFVFVSTDKQYRKHNGTTLDVRNSFGEQIGS